ncbi:MAG TPA: ABC transporter permease [Prolixibacteraceae bacterium]|nr:ABC transporter permease [Prolixibacteraceae bacterium]
MNLNYLRIFFRNLKRRKVISTINILGLVTGILSSLFIMEYVFFERSFDDYHPNASQVYRVVYNRYQHGKLQWETANSFYPTGKWMKDNFTEVKDYAVISRKYNITVNYEDAVGNKVFYNESKSYYATNSLFSLFSLPLLQGADNCLEKPNTVAISERVAQRYFGRENPLGKFLTVNNTEKYTVTAVYKSIPRNSHLQTDFLFSLSTLISQRQWMLNNWDNDYFHTYLLLQPGTNAEAFTRKAFPEMIAKNYKSSLDASNTRDEFFLQALPDIHLHSNIEYETEPPGNAKTINILFGFSIFLLMVAWINYINLVTAQSLERAREIGIRKINGGSKFRLILQFLAEALVFNLICLFITLAVFILIDPLFKSAAQIQDFNLFKHSGFLLIGILIFLSGIILSAIYPALVLSSYKPIAVLKGNYTNSSQGMFFRKGLVTIQFVISIILLIGTFITYRQADYLMEKEMGIHFTKTLVIRAPLTGNDQENHHNKLMVFKNQVLQLPEISDFTFSSDIPGQEIDHWFAGYRKGFNMDDMKAYFQIAVDDHYLDYYKIKLLAGRKFASGEQAHQHNIIMNVSAIQRFGFDRPQEAVDQIIRDWGGTEYRIVGIVDNFHYKSIKTEPVPTVLTLDDRDKTFLTLRFQQGANDGYEALRGKLNNIYQQHFPDQPFEYFSLDEKMRIDLKPDKTFASVFGLFSLLAILIAVIGIVGLILITINQKQKEMGIRKVLGAEIRDVSKVLSRQLFIQFMMALAVSIPLSYYGYESWFLTSYIYRIEMNCWFFIMPVVSIFLIVFSMVYLLAVNAYKANVSKVMQYE